MAPEGVEPYTELMFSRDGVENSVTGTCGTCTTESLGVRSGAGGAWYLTGVL